MKLTKRACLVCGPALARRRRAVFIESRFAAYARCSADRSGRARRSGDEEDNEQTRDRCVRRSPCVGSCHGKWTGRRAYRVRDCPEPRHDRPHGRDRQGARRRGHPVRGRRERRAYAGLRPRLVVRPLVLACANRSLRGVAPRCRCRPRWSRRVRPRSEGLDNERLRWRRPRGGRGARPAEGCAGGPLHGRPRHSRSHAAHAGPRGGAGPCGHLRQRGPAPERGGSRALSGSDARRLPRDDRSLGASTLVRGPVGPEAGRTDRPRHGGRAGRSWSSRPWSTSAATTRALPSRR